MFQGIFNLDNISNPVQQNNLHTHVPQRSVWIQIRLKDNDNLFFVVFLFVYLFVFWLGDRCLSLSDCGCIHNMLELNGYDGEKSNR